MPSSPGSRRAQEIPNSWLLHSKMVLAAPMVSNKLMKCARSRVSMSLSLETDAVGALSVGPSSMSPISMKQFLQCRSIRRSERLISFVDSIRVAEAYFFSQFSTRSAIGLPSSRKMLHRGSRKSRSVAIQQSHETRRDAYSFWMFQPCIAF